MTKEEFFAQKDQIEKEKDEIKEGIRKAREKGNLCENEDFDYWVNKREALREKIDAFESYSILNDKNSLFREYLYAYFKFKDFALKNELDYLSLLDDRAKFFDEHYNPDYLIDVKYNYEPTSFYDMSSFDGNKTFKNDTENVLNYFHNKKEKDVYVWELEYVSFLLFRDLLSNTFHAKEVIGDYRALKKSKECDEFVKKYDHILLDLKNNILDFNLLIWTIYKTYHYLRNKNSSFIYDKSDLVLIERLLSLSSSLVAVKYDKRLVKENNNLDKEENYFLFSMSQLLCLDLIHTIYDNFPDYYSSCIMFMGYNLYEPAGCSSLNTSMSSFDDFLSGIEDYDFWFDVSGPKTFDKLNLSKDYQEVLRRNDLI